MQIGNPAAISIYKGMRLATDALYSSMSKLSSGERIQKPGDAPSDFGISELLRYQIENGAQAKRNIENARNMIDTTDTWMQGVSDILSRMSELTIAASDGSKTLQDRDNLNTEYQQLKEEIGRIARSAKYNGVQIAGSDQILAYDSDLKTFCFSQIDGTERYTLPVKVLSGLQSQNSVDFHYDPTKSFTKSLDGKDIFYVDSNDNVVKYDIEKGALSHDAADSNDKDFDVDETGRLWFATETSANSGVFQLKQQDIASWTQDTSSVRNGDIADMASNEFRVFQNRVYYLNTSGDFVSRDVKDHNDVIVEVAHTDATFTTTEGQFAISQDGRFIADMPSAGVVRVLNTETKLSQNFALPQNIVPSSLSFSADNHELMYVDDNEGSIHSIAMTPDDHPSLTQDIVVENSSGAAGFAGIDVDGGSNRSYFRVHSGPDADQESFFTTGDVRLLTLGISRSRVDDVEEAQKALKATQNAIDKVSVQRARLGAEASRLDSTYNALVDYNDNIQQADSRIRDVDMAQESANLATLQMQHQAAIALMAQANSLPSTVLRLLQQ